MMKHTNRQCNKQTKSGDGEDYIFPMPHYGRGRKKRGSDVCKV
jgi:hypothetical protein